MAPIVISVRCSTGPKFDATVDDAATMREVKLQLVSGSGVAAPRMRLIFRGRVLSTDESTLEHYGVSDGDAVHLVQVTTPASTPAPAPAPAASSGFLGAAGDAGVGAAAGARFAGMPPMPSGHPQPSPAEMQRVMDSPLMDRLLSNPDLFQQIAMSNPQMRAMLESNPELRSIFRDPALLRQSMTAARNPNVMQEMMRNQDRALANIESLPGGYNALSRMYRDVQEPMQQAAAAARSSESQGGQNEEARGQTDGGVEPERRSMPNPWGAPSRSAGSGDSAAARAPASAANMAEAAIPFRNLAALLEGMSTSTGLGGGGGAGVGAQPAGFPLDFASLYRPAAAAAPATAAHAAAAAAAVPAGPTLDGPNPWAAPSSEDSPEQKYKEQLEKLESMGFCDANANVQELLRHNGDVDAAVESLIEAMAD